MQPDDLTDQPLATDHAAPLANVRVRLASATVSKREIGEGILVERIGCRELIISMLKEC
jgi:hypothetical protein